MEGIDTVMRGDDLAGNGLEANGAHIVAKTSPGPDNRAGGSRRKIRDSGEPGQEFMVFGQYTFDTRLLQHDFRDENSIGVLRMPPGQIACGGGIPGEDPVVQRGDLAGWQIMHDRRGGSVFHYHSAYQRRGDMDWVQFSSLQFVSPNDTFPDWVRRREMIEKRRVRA